MKRNRTVLLCINNDHLEFKIKKATTFIITPETPKEVVMLYMYWVHRWGFEKRNGHGDALIADLLLGNGAWLGMQVTGGLTRKGVSTSLAPRFALCFLAAGHVQLSFIQVLVP